MCVGAFGKTSVGAAQEVSAVWLNLLLRCNTDDFANSSNEIAASVSQNHRCHSAVGNID